MGSGIPIKSKTTKNAKDRNSAFVLRGGSCSLKMLLLTSVTNKQNLWAAAFLFLFQVVQYLQLLRLQYLYL